MRNLRSVRVDTKPFAELLNKPDEFEMVSNSMDHTIFSSFSIDAVLSGKKPEITEEKIRHRFLICEKWFRIMRGECGFGLRKTLDALPKALACELLSQPFDPMKDVARSWSPEALGFTRTIEKIKD